jgi:hypothetical protein
MSNQGMSQRRILEVNRPKYTNKERIRPTAREHLQKRKGKTCFNDFNPFNVAGCRPDRVIACEIEVKVDDNIQGDSCIEEGVRQQESTSTRQRLS